MPRRRKTPLTTTITLSSGDGDSGGTTGTSTSAPPFFTLAIEADKPNTTTNFQKKERNVKNPKPSPLFRAAKTIIDACMH
jgi:hypothetical protein